MSYKDLFYYLLWIHVKIVLSIYFRKIKISGKENIPKNGPVIFLGNHQNAFLDALLLVCNETRRTHFVARAGAFQNPFFKWLLSFLKMMPIYRIRDGWGNLAKNDEIFKACYNILKNDECLVVFPEGNHAFDRKLRPLSRGFTKIAFGAMDEGAKNEIMILPFGINYQSHQGFGKNVSLNIGKTFSANEFLNKDDIPGSANRLRDKAAQEMSKLIVNLDTDYDENLEKLYESGVDLSDLKQVQKVLNNESYERPKESKLKNIAATLFRFLNLPAYLIWRFIRKGIEDPVMLASIKFAMGISIFPISLISISYLLSYASPELYMAYPTLTLTITILYSRL